ncbi:MAG: hypothetical protein IT285_15710 [Bdellovibrionales bacterium]|nr:hypothetical protein [Bdellovibrionales bacterium]
MAQRISIEDTITTEKEAQGIQGFDRWFSDEPVGPLLALGHRNPLRKPSF